MSPNNLILYDTSYTNDLNDIDTGTVFINAKKIYIKNEDTEILVPIDIVNTNAVDTNEYKPPDADSRLNFIYILRLTKW